MIKNKAITAVHFFVTNSDGPVTGQDYTTLAMKVIGDGSLGGITATPAEVDATNAPGLYKVAMSAAENNYDFVTVAGKSTTSGVTISPVSWTNIANVEAVNGNEDVAIVQEQGALVMQIGTCAAGCSTTAIKADAGTLSSTDDQYNGRTLIFTTGAMKGQGKSISDYNGSGKTFTVETTTLTAADGDKFIVV